jgi:hypothetical protein
MKKLLIVCLLLVITDGIAQKNTKKKKFIPKKYKVKLPPKVDAKELTTFILNGYQLVSYSYGDFNGDQKQDAVLLLKQLDEEKQAAISEKPIERPLIILMRGEDEKLVPTARNDRAVYCYKCGSEFGSPLTEILIEGNTFSIHHEAGSAQRWTRLISFTYDINKSIFSLSKDASSSYDINATKPITNEVRTTRDFGVISFENFDVYSEHLKQNRN